MYGSMFQTEDLYACSISDFGTQNKKRVRVAERDIFIVKAHGQFYALDSFCYRKYYKINYQHWAVFS